MTEWMTRNYPQLGRIVFENEGWWKGQRVINEFTIDFYVDGGKDGPKAELANICLLVLSNFQSFWQQALELARKEAPKYGVINCDDFSPTELWGFWQKRVNRGFTMSLSREGDSENLWRVQFDNWDATYFGCDT